MKADAKKRTKQAMEHVAMQQLQKRDREPLRFVIGDRVLVQTPERRGSRIHVGTELSIALTYSISSWILRSGSGQKNLVSLSQPEAQTIHSS